jgi:hypothetical protein
VSRSTSSGQLYINLQDYSIEKVLVRGYNLSMRLRPALVAVYLLIAVGIGICQPVSITSPYVCAVLPPGTGNTTPVVSCMTFQAFSQAIMPYILAALPPQTGGSGPAGPQGPQGPAGPAGAPGVAGAAGTVTGGQSCQTTTVVAALVINGLCYFIHVFGPSGEIAWNLNPGPGSGQIGRTEITATDPVAKDLFGNPMQLSYYTSFRDVSGNATYPPSGPVIISTLRIP